jgi:hypothetical protein
MAWHDGAFESRILGIDIAMELLGILNENAHKGVGVFRCFLIVLRGLLFPYMLWPGPSLTKGLLHLVEI